MKRILMSIVVVTLLVVSCDDKPKYACVDATLDLLESYTEQLEDCDSYDDVVALQTRIKKDLKRIEKKYSDSADQLDRDVEAGKPEAKAAQKKVDRALKDFLDACVSTHIRLGVNSMQDGSLNNALDMDYDVGFDDDEDVYEDIDEDDGIVESDPVGMNDGDYSYLAERQLTDADVRNLSKTEIRILRNAIYARHGYIFKSKDMKEFFSQFVWYQPLYHDVSSLLNAVEHKNVAFLQKYE